MHLCSRRTIAISIRFPTFLSDLTSAKKGQSFGEYTHYSGSVPLPDSGRTVRIRILEPHISRACVP